MYGYIIILTILKTSNSYIALYAESSTSPSPLPSPYHHHHHHNFLLGALISLPSSTCRYPTPGASPNPATPLSSPSPADASSSSPDISPRSSARARPCCPAAA